MTIQWTLVATFLYCELAFITMLLLPFISPTVWKYILDSRLCKAIASRANIGFTIFIAILSLFFVESVREMHKYSGGLHDHEHTNLGSEIQLSMKLFRSQRNFYIAGFALFLWFVIRRLITLIISEAILIAENESVMRRAQNATEAAQKLLKQEEKRKKDDFADVEFFKKEISSLQNSLAATENELETNQKTLSDVINQAEAVSKEYQQLLKKYELENPLSNSTDKNEE